MNQPARSSLASVATIGTTLCIASAVGYSAANVCLRELAGRGVDFVWVICIKELVTVVVVGGYLLVRAVSGSPVRISVRAAALLAAVGVPVQLVGNLSVQWAMGLIGLALTIPILFGTMLTSSAILGWLLLGERVSRRSIIAITLLVCSIGLLSVGAKTAPIASDEGDRAATSTRDASSEESIETYQAVASVAGISLAGVIFAGLSVAIRKTTADGAPVSWVVFLITSVGGVLLGLICVQRLGYEAMVNTPPDHLAWMLAAGTFNLLAFLALSKGLHLTTIVRANVLNAAQVALGVLAGIWYFSEAWNGWGALGVFLTIGGILLVGRPISEEPEVPGA